MCDALRENPRSAAHSETLFSHTKNHNLAISVFVSPFSLLFPPSSSSFTMRLDCSSSPSLTADRRYPVSASSCESLLLQQREYQQQAEEREAQVFSLLEGLRRDINAATIQLASSSCCGNNSSNSNNETSEAAQQALAWLLSTTVKQIHQVLPTSSSSSSSLLSSQRQQSQLYDDCMDDDEDDEDYDDDMDMDDTSSSASRPTLSSLSPQEAQLQEELYNTIMASPASTLMMQHPLDNPVYAQLPYKDIKVKPLDVDVVPQSPLVFGRYFLVAPLVFDEGFHAASALSSLAATALYNLGLARQASPCGNGDNDDNFATAHECYAQAHALLDDLSDTNLDPDGSLVYLYLAICNHLSELTSSSSSSFSDVNEWQASLQQCFPFVTPHMESPVYAHFWKVIAVYDMDITPVQE